MNENLRENNRRVVITRKPCGMPHYSLSASCGIASQPMAFNLVVIDQDEDGKDQTLFEATFKTNTELMAFVRNSLERQLVGDSVYR